MSESVIVVPYDPDWPRRFEQEGAVLGAVFAGSDAAIEHVGSTAVPGLGAKPVIDVMVGLLHLAEAESRIAALEAVDYAYVQKYETQLPWRRYFRKPRLGSSAYHLHCDAAKKNTQKRRAPSSRACLLLRWARLVNGRPNNAWHRTGQKRLTP